MSDPASFFQRVYAVTGECPAGRVTTYGVVSERVVGHRGAARTVGWALHALSAERSEQVPWWRVINRYGRVSSSCATHSAALQRALLEDEGIIFGADDRVDMTRFGWPD